MPETYSPADLLKLLGIAVIVGLAHLFWGALAARRQQGLKWARGPRDEPMPVNGMAARLERAFANFRETFPLFAAALISVVLAGKTGPIPYWGAVVYVAGRALYLPSYAFAFGARTFIWMASTLGLVAVVAGLFL